MKPCSVWYLKFLSPLLLLFGTLTVAHAGPLTPGNILLTTGDFPASMLFEVTQVGELVQSFTVPFPDGRPVTETVRDIIVSLDGRVHIYNGTFSPFLTTLDPATGVFEHDRGVGFSTVNNLSFGGIDRFLNFVYVTDMNTGGSPDAGIVRFDMVAGTSQRFASGSQPIDLALGQDGLLYALGDFGGLPSFLIKVYDPLSMSLLRTINLDTDLFLADLRGISVAADGTLFAVGNDGGIYHISSSGSTLKRLSSGVLNLLDINLSETGTLVIGSRFGEVFFTDTSLSGVRSFQFGGNPLFVAFVGGQSVPDPSSLALLATGLGLVGFARKRVVATALKS